MKKVYHLATCSTCQRILKEIKAEGNGFELQDIKTAKMTEVQLDEMRALSGSYEALFSRKAMKYRSMGLGDKELNEADYKSLILDEYTFLKRPVTLLNAKIFIGNAKSTTAAILEELS